MTQKEPTTNVIGSILVSLVLPGNQHATGMLGFDCSNPSCGKKRTDHSSDRFFFGGEGGI